MKGQAWYVAVLIGVMCLIRFSLSAVGYADPSWLMEQFGIPTASNLQMPYIIRVWAIRDVVLAIFVAFADKTWGSNMNFALFRDAPKSFGRCPLLCETCRPQQGTASKERRKKGKPKAYAYLSNKSE